ncbi:MAG: Plastocyanin [Syntrophus sp. SKADARSKE-3]|nr:Plastocyanin [Syntrophus sp. SKADARSKE-3]
MVSMPTRRDFLKYGGAVICGLAFPNLALIESGNTESRHINHSNETVEILMRSDPTGADVWFDPIGILIQPGQTVRWRIEAGVHTATAYHPRNSNHSLRIPLNAKPWDSGYLVNPGDYFEMTLPIEGVYDYYCMPHEMAGMVGRIVVGKPVGPGTLPFDYFRGRPEAATWEPVPEAAQKEFPSVNQIMKDKIVHRR